MPLPHATIAEQTTDEEMDEAKDLLQQHVKHAKKVRARQEGNSECDSSETNKAETLARISVNEGSSSDWHSAFHISLVLNILWRNPYFFSRNATRVLCNPTSAFRSVDASSDQARHKKLMWDELLPRSEADKIRMMRKQLKKSDIGTLEQRLHQNVCWLIQVAYFIFLGAIHEHLFR
ncbi:hypothetical protein Tco_1307363 [Tanacetum coccineum]